MSAAVDVLNLLRKFERTYMVAGLTEEAGDIATIFAATAELIEADRAFDACSIAGGTSESWDSYYAAKARRDAALANISGAS